MNVRTALAGLQVPHFTVVAGLGGRPIGKASLHAMLRDATADRLGPLTFLDLDHRLVERELARQKATRRSGPQAENLLRDVGVIGARPVGGA